MTPREARGICPNPLCGRIVKMRRISPNLYQCPKCHRTSALDQIQQVEEKRDTNADAKQGRLFEDDE